MVRATAFLYFAAAQGKNPLKAWEGFGLAVCKRVIEVQGGNIGVESTKGRVMNRALHGIIYTWLSLSLPED